MKLRNIALRNIRRNLRRSILSAIAITVATLTIVFLFALIHGMMLDMKWNITSYVTGQIRLRNKEYDKYEMMNPVHLNIKNEGKIIQTVENLPNTTITVPRIPFFAIVYRDGNSFNIKGVGLDFGKERKFQNLDRYIVKGNLPTQGSNGVIMGYKLAEDMGLKLGDSFTAMTTTVYRGSNAMTFKLTGLASFGIGGLNASTFYAPLSKVQKLVKADDSVTEILVKVSRESMLKETVQKISQLLKGGGDTEVDVKAYTSLDTTLSFMGMAQSAYDIIALIFFILASSVIVNTTMMVIFERMKEIGTIGAIGMTGSQVQRLFFLEAFYIGIMGALAGVIIGIGITIPLSHTGINFGSALEGTDFEISNILRPVLDIRSTVGVFIYSVVISSLATVVPTRKAAQIEPVDALKSI